MAFKKMGMHIRISKDSVSGWIQNKYIKTTDFFTRTVTKIMGKKMLITRIAKNTKHLEITLIRNVKVQEQYGDKTKHCIHVLFVHAKKIIRGMFRIFIKYIPI